MDIWFGVVENVDDPLQLGRVQVRIAGVHSEMLVRNEETGKGIPRDALPWAMPMQSINSAAISGKGYSPTGLVQGSWVCGFSRDGKLMNDLIVMGSIGGIPRDVAKPQEGFNDPTGEYPIADLVGEADTNRLARGDITGTVHEKINENRELSVITARGSAWNEPKTAYEARYPYNFVHESLSKHVHEIDDTPGAERVTEIHKAGTYYEIRPDGTRVTKIVGNDYEIVIKDKNVYIKGELNITIDGDATIYTKGDTVHKVDGDYTLDVAGSIDITGKDVTIDGGAFIDMDAGRIDLN